MAFMIPTVVFVACAVIVVPTDSSLPIPFELSIADPEEWCRDAAQRSPRRISSVNTSLCFGSLEESRARGFHWRAMFMSVDLENQTLQMELKIRRVRIFTAAAGIRLAGGESVPVSTVLKDLDINHNFNGYGTASEGSTRSSVVFMGQLTTTQFEGRIIYNSLNRSHSMECLHKNSLRPDFFKHDACLSCVIATYDAPPAPTFPGGWRSEGNPLCKDNGTSHENGSHSDLGYNDAHTNTSTVQEDEEESGFPRTGFSDYKSDQPNRPPELRNGADTSREANMVDKKGSESFQTTVDPIGHIINAADKELRGSASTAKSDDQASTQAVSTSSDLPTLKPESVAARAQKPLGARRHPKQTVLQQTDTATNSKSHRQRRSARTKASGTRKSFPQPDSSKKSKFYRQRRSGRHSENDSYVETVSCSLHLVADHLFFADMGDRSSAKTVNLMLSVIIGADAVFRATDFDGNGVRDNIGFLVKNITIMHNSSAALYDYSRSNDDSFQYLRSFSTVDFSDVCLGVAFTAIDFQRGVVGLAWYASSMSGGTGKGGICGQRVYLRSEENSFSKGGICGQRVYLRSEENSFSFNTAIVTFVNHGTSVSMEKAILTMAHEFGHCFGSSHDDMKGKWLSGPVQVTSADRSEDWTGSACNREYPQGSYLMQKYRPSLYSPNNYKFSPCSLRQMYPVIARKGGCLTRYYGPTCGNGVVEDGEECDCGLTGACRFNDPCCSPGDAPPSSPDPPCTVRRSQGLDCSPVTSSCCSDKCKHLSQEERYVCRQAADCYKQAICDGQGPLCPVSTLQPDGTPCHGSVRVCVGGGCRDSLCVRAGLEDCFCSGREEDRCKLCCKRSHNSPCLPAAAFNITGQADIYLQEGDGCLNYRGVCTLGRKDGDHDTRYCATVDSLDGDFSALIGLASDSGSGDRAAAYNTWLYLLLLPVLPAVAVLVWRTGPRITTNTCRRPGHGEQASNSPRLAALVTTAHSRSRAFDQQARRAAAACDRICSRLEQQEQGRRQLHDVAKHATRRRQSIVSQGFLDEFMHASLVKYDSRPTKLASSYQGLERKGSYQNHGPKRQRSPHKSRSPRRVIRREVFPGSARIPSCPRQSVGSSVRFERVHGDLSDESVDIRLTDRPSRRSYRAAYSKHDFGHPLSRERPLFHDHNTSRSSEQTKLTLHPRKTKNKSEHATGKRPRQNPRSDSYFDPAVRLEVCKGGQFQELSSRFDSQVTERRNEGALFDYSSDQSCLAWPSEAANEHNTRLALKARRGRTYLQKAKRERTYLATEKERPFVSTQRCAPSHMARDVSEARTLSLQPCVPRDTAVSSSWSSGLESNTGMDKSRTPSPEHCVKPNTEISSSKSSEHESNRDVNRNEAVLRDFLKNRTLRLDPDSESSDVHESCEPSEPSVLTSLAHVHRDGTCLPDLYTDTVASSSTCQPSSEPSGMESIANTEERAPVQHSENAGSGSSGASDSVKSGLTCQTHSAGSQQRSLSSFSASPSPASTEASLTTFPSAHDGQFSASLSPTNTEASSPTFSSEHDGQFSASLSPANTEASLPTFPSAHDGQFSASPSPANTEASSPTFPSAHDGQFRRSNLSDTSEWSADS
ncbi:uncharacterized protein [Littorina saxatilis]|uniref:uncharacterized protein n=1 Tax=Littorina saxatilis TaxID=31220 RepID=UPI0038B68F86